MKTVDWVRVGLIVFCLVAAAVLNFNDKDAWGWFLFFAFVFTISDWS